MAIKSDLFNFWKQQEIELGREITVAEVSRATGMHRNTIQKLRDDKTARFDEPVLDSICEFFNVSDGPIPFLIYVSGSNGENE